MSGIASFFLYLALPSKISIAGKKHRPSLPASSVRSPTPGAKDMHTRQETTSQQGKYAPQRTQTSYHDGACLSPKRAGEKLLKIPRKVKNISSVHMKLLLKQIPFKRVFFSPKPTFPNKIHSLKTVIT